MMTPTPKYQRILLKLSGEALMGAEGAAFEPEFMTRVAREILELRERGVRISLVIGGGNIFRGAASGAVGVERSKGDYMGMLATVINGLAVEGVLRNTMGIPAVVMSAIPMPTVCEPFSRDRALAYLDEGRVVILAGGTGNPFFTTDTAAALRAAEMSCDALLKGTQVDGVYSADPKKYPEAERYETLGYQEVLERKLGVMDATAIALARENDIPIVVFSIHNPGSLVDVVMGTGRCTVVE